MVVPLVHKQRVIERQSRRWSLGQITTSIDLRVCILLRKMIVLNQSNLINRGNSLCDSINSCLFAPADHKPAVKTEASLKFLPARSAGEKFLHHSTIL